MHDCSLDKRRVCSERLSSPLISSGAKLKCLQFWFYGWSSSLKVSLFSKYKKRHFWFRAYPRWRQRRVAVSEDFPYQVNDIIEELLGMLTVAVLFVSSVL